MRGVAQIDGVNILTPLEPGKSSGITTLTFDGYAPEDLQGLVGRIYSDHNTVVKSLSRIPHIKSRSRNLDVLVQNFTREVDSWLFVPGASSSVTSQSPQSL